MTETRAIRVSCSRGMAPYLTQELSALGHAPRELAPTALELRGTLHDAWRLNLQLRTALSVLWPLASFPCSSPDELFEATRAVPWEEHLGLESNLSVVSRVDTPTISDPRFANLRVKDAIVDRMRDQLGDRPPSGPERTGAVVRAYWWGNQAQLFADLSGQKLSDRGYRKRPHMAPLRETLAAGLLLAAGYDGAQPFVNPMCGSGTLAIEAALIGSGRAPGLLRSDYGLQHWRSYDAEAWQEIRREVKAAPLRTPAPIVATDHNPQAIEAARHNAQTAGVEALIEFGVCDFTETPIPAVGEAGGVVMLNPEYGLRLGDTAALAATYNEVGDLFKQHFKGWTGFLFTGNAELAKKVGLRTSRRLPFFNGDIECRLLRYELYAGSKKQKKQGQAPGGEPRA
ncbi:MAG: class I SAM-dependent RNA methyltransferase [Planctomycetes bacterium]|nr:class I SAM-dependent RNA methyltransferase [Planctomycetota bacterium]